MFFIFVYGLTTSLEWYRTTFSNCARVAQSFLCMFVKFVRRKHAETNMWTNAQFLRSTVAYWIDPWNAYKSSKPSPKSQRFAKSERFLKNCEKTIRICHFCSICSKVVRKGGEVLFSSTFGCPGICICKYQFSMNLRWQLNVNKKYL